MRLTTIASPKNLELAWRRISTGTNHPYKRFFRPLYYAYELSIGDNLRDLRSRILARAWDPRLPERVYLPKASGLQRPLTLLYIEDQIVLQAFANIIAAKLAPKRQPFVMRKVFSNILAEPNSIFFFRDWRRTYAEYQRQIRRHFDAGLRWVADFDLAAFYETISHDLLLRTSYPRLDDTPEVLWIKKCLATWTSTRISSLKGHGLPQGPIASDFLAEAFLLPIDQKMSSVDGYVRYVDDVRLFADSENAVRSGTLVLEIHCRERGLIPQVGKFSIRNVQSVDEAFGMLPSIHDPRDADTGPKISRSQAEQLMKTAVRGRPLAVADKTRFRYVLFRAEPSPRLFRQACSLLPRYPEHIDALLFFLSQYGFRRAIRDCCLEIMAATPYDYVKGEIWHLLAGYYAEDGALSPLVKRKLIDQAITTLREKAAGFSRKWGAGHFLCVADATDGTRYSKFLNHQSSSLLQATVARHLPPSAFEPGGPAQYFLRRKSFEPSIALAEGLHRLNVQLAILGVPVDSLPPQTRNTFARLGITPSAAPVVDVIGELIERRYDVANSGQWRRLLGGEYAHAAGLLAQADAVYLSGPSYWLSHQNSFNQAVFLKLQGHLNAVRDPGAVRTVGRDGRLVKFGTTLDHNNSFSRRYPLIANALRTSNERRNRLPGSHPYEIRSAVRTQYLKPTERNILRNLLATAFREISTLVP
jgi:hypothetical protein